MQSCEHGKSETLCPECIKRHLDIKDINGTEKRHAAAPSVLTDGLIAKRWVCVSCGVGAPYGEYVKHISKTCRGELKPVFDFSTKEARDKAWACVKGG